MPGCLRVSRRFCILWDGQHPPPDIGTEEIGALRACETACHGIVGPSSIVLDAVRRCSTLPPSRTGPLSSAGGCRTDMT